MLHADMSSQSVETISESSQELSVLRRLELYFSVRHTLRTMRQFAELFEYDYDLLMIFMTVAEVGLQAVFHLAAVNAQEIDVEATFRELGAAGLSILSIGEATGIPRETVRRKVHRLVDMGYLSIRPKDKNAFIPASAIRNPDLLRVFTFHVSEVTTLVRTIRYYGKDHKEV
jgi:CRP-like cAMP-binding protein